MTTDPGIAPDSPKPAADGKQPGGGPVEALRAKWAIGAAVVAWLVSIIAPALSFNVRFEMYNDIDIQFRAYFQIMCTVLFLLAWRPLKRLPLWALVSFAVLSMVLFISYSIALQSWTCLYPDVGPFVRSNTYTAKVLADLSASHIPQEPCGTVMSLFVDPAGNPYSVWNKHGWDGMVPRFLTLFGLYSLAWLSLALLIAGAVLRALQDKEPG